MNPQIDAAYVNALIRRVAHYHWLHWSPLGRVCKDCPYD